MNPINNKIPDIIIVDNHLIFRQGLKAILNFEEIGSVIGEASDGEEFIELLSTLNPDLVLMDIDMLQINDFNTTIKALQIQPKLNIIVFTVFSDEDYYNKIMAIGAKGLILKSCGFSELESAINTVMKGENYFFDLIENKNDQKTSLDDKPLINTTEKMLFFSWFFHLKACIKYKLIDS